MEHLIIGNGAAGSAAAQAILDVDKKSNITVLSDEPNTPYSRVMLPLYIAGKIKKEELYLSSGESVPSNVIHISSEGGAAAVDFKNQKIIDAKGRHIPYDKLLVATGSLPKELDVPGRDLDGLYYLRNMSDADTIKNSLELPAEPVVIVGDGPIAMKCLEAAVARGKKACLVTLAGRLLEQIMDSEASAFFYQELKKRGVEVRLNTEVEAFTGKERVEGMALSDGTTIHCGMAIIGIGVRPNTAFLCDTGIPWESGVPVDEQMAADVPNTYAAGDVADMGKGIKRETGRYALWPLARLGGRIAGLNMAGILTSLQDQVRMNSIGVFCIKAVSVGDLNGTGEVKFGNREKGIYRKIVYSGKRITGFIIVGDIRSAGIVTALINNKTDVDTSLMEDMAVRGFSYSPRLQKIIGSYNIKEIIPSKQA